MASQPLGDAADRLRRREVLLRGLFSAFADYSSKAATIFRELAELSEPPGNSKKSAPQRRGASQAGKPKKLTGYQLFANQQRQELKASRPDASFGEVSQQIGTMWNGMNVAEKTVYTERADTMEKSSSVVRNPITGGVVVSKTIEAHNTSMESPGGIGGGAVAGQSSPPKHHKVSSNGLVQARQVPAPASAQAQASSASPSTAASKMSISGPNSGLLNASPASRSSVSSLLSESPSGKRKREAGSEDEENEEEDEEQDEEGSYS